MKKLITCLALASTLLTLGQTANELVKIHEFADINSLNTLVNPAPGSFGYTLNNNFMHYFNGTSWIQIPASGGSGDNWKLSGNSVIASDFLGTTNNQALTFRQNNIEKWRMETNGTLTPLNSGNSVFIGDDVGSNDDFSDNRNVAIGYRSLTNNTSGFGNVALGQENLHSNTTGNQNIAIGVRSLFNNTAGQNNVALGFQCLNFNTTGYYNVALGVRTLRFNTTGNNNIALGYASLESGNGSFNIALGFQSLSSNLSGHHNVALGRENLLSNTTGQNNIAIGTEALYENTIGSYNIALGEEALNRNNGGEHNIANGYQTLSFNSLGHHNVALGRESLNFNTTGYFNTAIGTYSLRWTGTGIQNTAIGYRASENSGSPDNSTTLGANTNHAGSNTVRIGNNVSSIGGPEAWTNYSDARFKRNVRENVVGLDFILGLRPVTYNFDYKAINRHQKGTDTIQTEETYKELEEIVKIGFLAQEVEVLADSLEFDFHGVDKPRFDEDVYGLRYSEFVPSLVKAIQEQQKHIQAQQVQIKQLNKRIETLEKK